MVDYVSANQQTMFEAQMRDAMKTPATIWRTTKGNGPLGVTNSKYQLGGTIYCMAIAGQRRNDEQWQTGAEAIQSTVYWHVAFPKGSDIQITDEIHLTGDNGTVILQILGTMEPMTYQFADWVLCLEIV